MLMVNSRWVGLGYECLMVASSTLRFFMYSAQHAKHYSLFSGLVTAISVINALQLSFQNFHHLYCSIHHKNHSILSGQDVWFQIYFNKY